MGRAVFASARNKREEQIREGLRLVRLSAQKQEARVEAASEKVMESEAKAVRKGMSKGQENELAGENRADLRRVIKGHSINALSNFMDDGAARERRNKKEARLGAAERVNKKQRKHDLKWDPVGAGKRERRAKAARKFLGVNEKLTLQKKTPAATVASVVKKDTKKAMTKIERLMEEAAQLQAHAAQIRKGVQVNGPKQIPKLKPFAITEKGITPASADGRVHGHAELLQPLRRGKRVAGRGQLGPGPGNW